MGKKMAQTDLETPFHLAQGWYLAWFGGVSSRDLSLRAPRGTVS